MCISPKILNYKPENSNSLCKAADITLTNDQSSAQCIKTLQWVLLLKMYSLISPWGNMRQAQIETLCTKQLAWIIQRCQGHETYLHYLRTGKNSEQRKKLTAKKKMRKSDKLKICDLNYYAIVSSLLPLTQRRHCSRIFSISYGFIFDYDFLLQ